MKIDRRSNRYQEFVEDANHHTDMTRSQVEDLRRLLAQITLDTSKQYRESQQECKFCFYKTTIAGSAFTDYKCEICQNTYSHPNTAVPSYCINCSKDQDICKNCGAFIDEI